MPRKVKELSEETEAVEKKITAKKSTSKTVKEAKTAIDKENVKTTARAKTASKTKANTTKKSRTQTKSKNSVTPKSNSTKKTKRTNSKVASNIVEYYDLPFRYNQTVVKILAQTPNTLFIYWDISDDDRKIYTEKYGKDFFNNTRPYLIITNKTMNYSFEVEINDFANSWYLHINDASCEYKVELGRKFIINSNDFSSENGTLENDTHFEPYHINDYLYITSSNEIETPNDHILFDTLNHDVFFKNVKTNVIEEKNVTSISFLQRIGKVYNIYDLYKEIYHDELISNEFSLDFPSSNTKKF